MTRGAIGHAVVSRVASKRFRYQTFHSSNEMLSFFLVFSRAPTLSAVATTLSTKWSMSTAEARKLSRSPSSGS